MKTRLILLFFVFLGITVMWTIVVEKEPYDVGIPFRIKIGALVGRYLMMGYPPPWLIRWLQSRKAPTENKGYIIEMKEISYDHSTDEKVTIDTLIYTPKNLTEDEFSQVPIFLYFHGGGFTIGHPYTVKNFLDELISLDPIIVVAPVYRKLPEHTIDSGINDGLEALRYIKKKYGSHRKIVMCGSSAGGRIALALSYYLKNTNYEEYEKSLITTIPIMAAFCRSMECRKDSRFKNGYITNEQLAKDVPAEEVDYLFDFDDVDNLPRMIVVTAEYCYLRDEAWNWVNKDGWNTNNNIRPEYFMFEKEVHGFLLPFFTMNKSSVPKLAKIISERALFLQQK